MKFKLNFKLTCIMVNFTVYNISNSKKNCNKPPTQWV